MKEFFSCSVSLVGYVSCFLFEEKKETDNWTCHGSFRAEVDPAKAAASGLEEFKICYALNDHVCTLRRVSPLPGERHVASFFASPEPRPGFVQWNVYRTSHDVARFFSPLWQREDWELDLSFWVPDERLELPWRDNGKELLSRFSPSVSLVTAFRQGQEESDFFSALETAVAQVSKKPGDKPGDQGAGIETQSLEVVVVEEDGEENSSVSSRLLAPENYPFRVVVVFAPSCRSGKKRVGLPPLLNIGALRAGGEVFLLQDSDCLQVSGVLAHAGRVPSSSACLYPCLGAETSEDAVRIRQEVASKKFPQKEEEDSLTESGRWLQHPRYNNRRAFFGLAIRRKDFFALGGFSEVFSQSPEMQWEEFSYRASLRLRGGIRQPGHEGGSPWLFCQRPVAKRNQGWEREQKQVEKESLNRDLYKEMVEAEGSPFPGSGVFCL